MDDHAIAGAVFFPRPDMPWGPAAPGAFELTFDVGDDGDDAIRQRVRVMPADAHDGPVGRPSAPADLLFFHGNGETARDYDPGAHEFAALGATLWAAEYRGYGIAEGEPSVHSFLTDAHQALDAVLAWRAEHGGRPTRGPLVVMGRSLGSAPAIELAAMRPADVDGLIIESGFARIVPLLALCGVPDSALDGVSEDWGPRNLAKIETVSIPLLILHAEQDDIIPIRDAELLHAAAQDPDREFLRVPGAGHNDIQPRAGARYFQAIGRLLGRLQAHPGATTP